MGINLFEKKFRPPIYALYGFVRFADEIVDTFHDFDKRKLFDQFKADTYQAIDLKISLNPILQSFQEVVNKYNIQKELIASFLYSMEMDLDKSSYKEEDYKKYIFGSAEAVGLMCLKVFTEGNEEKYLELESSACALGSAFQKINFLRDIKSDYNDRGRIYFPNVNFKDFTDEQKLEIEKDIEQEFDQALMGIKNLPKGCKLGVYISYRYFRCLLNKISVLPISKVKEERIRVTNAHKFYLLTKSTIRHTFNLI
jgi:phytoene/squalene synthetase